MPNGLVRFHVLFALLAVLSAVAEVPDDPAALMPPAGPAIDVSLRTVLPSGLAV